MEHAPTIGRMYEGLTKKVLGSVPLDKFDVRVVSGFMRVGDKISGQIDCMIVMGEGECVPQTDEFVYPIQQVIAVLEVKKNLLATGMMDAYDHLNQTLQLSKLDCKLRQEQGVLEFSSARPAKEFASLFGERAPKYPPNELFPFHKRVIYHSLVRDMLTPVRIAIGYNGYKSEGGLRRGVENLYKNRANILGFGVINMPNLIISDGFSIIKTNGLPYRGGWHDDLGWGWLASSNSNPILLILELVYDRIELMLDVEIDRGLDLEMEVLDPLIFGLPVKMEKGAAWQYKINSGCLPKNAARKQEWAPLELSRVEKELLDLIEINGDLLLDSPMLSDFKSRHAISDIHDFAASLLKERVVLKTNDGLTVSYGDFSVEKVAGKWYCGDSGGGRFKQWIARNSTLPQSK
ncbi:DUF6602 domain-containing protein [Burkholderia vietnamiensis]|uniref:DUF6602 domain-containing protein n=1 Tax=Burkholderia vietnamiensis TaxID=60552 RepID=UPI00351DEB10